MSERTEAIYNSIRNNYGRLANGARPWENNRDEMNDVLNYAPTEGQQTYSIGTDDAGNEILGNTVNDFMAQPQPKEEDNSFFAGTSWGGDINAAEASERILADEEGGETNLPELIDGGRVDLGQELSALHDRMKDTSLYAQYMYSADDWAEKGKEIFDATGMDVNSLGDKNIFEKAWNLTREIKRQKALATDASGHVNMDKVYEAMPYLRDIHEAHGTAAAVMVMNSARELQTINDVYDSEAARFAASIGYGIYRGGLSVVNQYTGAKAMARGLWSNQGLTQEEMNDILWVSNEMKKLPQNSYSSFGSILGGVLGSAAENAPIMLPEMIRTAAVNLGKLTGPAGMAASAGVYALMSAQIGGAQYIENITKTDENGNPIYTPRQAALLSAFQGFAEAALEKRSIAAAGKAVFSAGTAKKLSELAAKDVALASGQTMGGVTREAAREILRERIQHGFKAGILSGAAELEEEFEQQISDMVLENMAQIAFRGGEADVSSVDEILSEAFGAAVEALPAVAGFGFMGAGGSVVADTERVLSMRERFANAKASEIARGIYENQHQQNIVYNVAENLDNVQELQGKAPEIVTEILDAQNKKAGAEDTDVNIGMLMQKDGGADIVNQIAAENGTSQEDVQACINGTGFLTVKTSALQQAIHKMTPEQQQAVFPNVAAVGRQTNEQILSYARDMKAALDAVKDKTDKETAETIERFVRESFEDEDTRKTAAEIIASDTDNPYEAAKRRVRANQADVDEYLKDTIDALKSEAGQGTSVVETMDENGDITTGRASNNPLWYQNFYADTGRAPTNADYERIAYENLTGTATRYAMMSYGNLTPEDVAYFEGVKNELDALLSEKDRLRTIADALKGFGKGDFLPTASMPAETRKAYNSIYQILSASDNKKVRDNARVNAILAARMLSRLGFMWKDDAGRDVNLMEILPKLAANAVYGEGTSDLMQTPERNLVAYHNTTEEALSQTIDNGIAMPSLAIVKKDIPFTNFGSITLIGNQELVDPTKGTHVYSRDAYTTRMPRPEYATPSKKQLTAFEKEWMEKLKNIPGGEDLVKKLVSDAKYYPENIEPHLKFADELAYYYLTKVKGKDVQLFHTKPAYQNELLALEQQDMIAVLSSDGTEEEKREKLKKPIIDLLSLKIELTQDAIDRRRKQTESKAWLALFEKAEQKDKEEIAEYQKQIDDIQENGVSHELYDELQKDFDRVAEAEKQSTQIDWTRTRNNMPKEDQNILYGREYQKFISDIDKQLRGEARVKVGRKYLPYTTENLVKAMLAHSGSAQEEWGGYSPARVAAAGSKRFSTLDEIRASKGKLVSEKEAEQVVVEVNLDLHDRFADARKYHKFLEENDFDLEDIFNEAVGKAIKGNRTATAANVKSAFHSMDFDVEKMPASLIADIVKAANHVKDAAAWYFEAKPQRAVDVGEFSAAVVPIGTSQELIQKLKDKGLMVKEYKGDVEGARELAIQEVQAEKPDVLFQKQDKSLAGNNESVKKQNNNRLGYRLHNTNILDRVNDKMGYNEVRELILREENTVVVALLSIYKNRLKQKADTAGILEELNNAVFDICAKRRALNESATAAYVGRLLRSRGQARKGSYLAENLRWIINPRGDREVLPEGLNEIPGEHRRTYDDTIVKNIIAKLDTERLDEIASEFTAEIREHAENQGALFNAQNSEQALDMLMQAAWHGSPHVFTQFDLGSIGTGEGHQAHGWGLYFAQDKEVSQRYRDELTRAAQAEQYEKVENLKFKGKTLQQWYESIQNDMDRIDPRSKEYEVLRDKYYMMEQTILHQHPDTVIAEAKEDELNKKAITWYEKTIAKNYPEPETPGSLLEVEIPDDDVLLDEQKPLSEQPEKVKAAIREYYRSRPESYISDDTEFDLGGSSGGDFYKDVVFQMRREGSETPERAASELLNEYGIKGIAYDGRMDGRCYVVFDDKSISIIDTYNQRMNGETYRGGFSAAMNFIKLFQDADESTFMHEMSHFYLNELQKIAMNAGENSQAAKDLATINGWAEWKEGDAEEYKGTASASEFAKREKQIKEAQQNGFAVMEDGTKKTLAELLNEWRQEKFARGFEEYLHEGKAPTSTLKRIFRRFRDWLKQIYKDVTGAGVKPSAEVEAVFARMIASDEEIEMQATIDRAADISRIDPDLMDADTEAMHERWAEEAKEEAKDKLRKELLKEQREKDVAAHMEAYEAEERSRLMDIPSFQAELFVQEAGLPEEEAAEAVGYTSAEAWKEDLKELGGSYENAVKMSCDAERDRYIREMPNDVHLQELAEEALVSSEYAGRLASLEAEALRRREKKYANAPKRLAKAMEGMEAALAEEKEEPLEKVLRTLKYSFRWQRQQQEQIEAMQSTIDEMKARIARDKEASENAAAQSEADKEALREKIEKQAEKGKEKLRAKLKEQVNTFKNATMLNAEWLRGVRDAADGMYKMNRELAKQQLAAMPVKDSTNIRRFIGDARKAAAESARAIANAVRKNNGLKKADTGEKDYEKARQAKLRQALFGAQAREALNLRRELQRLVNHLKRREKTLAKEKHGEIDASTKYYINHILYMMGFKTSDAIRPQTLESFGAHIASLKDAWDADNEANGNVGDLDMDFDVPDWLLNLATSGDKQQPGNYREFTMAELQDVKALVDILYTTGRNKNRLLSMDRNKDEVVFELMQDFDRTVTVEKGDTGISSVMASLLQPVVMLKTLGKKWKEYFYDTLADAWERKTAMQQQAAQDLNALFEKHWDKKTRRKMRTKKLGITLPDGTELTKEGVISMALNWGNDGNRKRLMNGFSMTDRDVEEIFKQTMTANDWAFIQEAWDYINAYGDKVNEVVEKSTGTPMKRVEPRSFVIETEDGKTIALRGGYYPISYDPVKSLGHAEQELMSASQAMGGASAFGTGMGSTKARSENGLQESPLLLSADVLFRHINQQIHIATMRLACRDVYKLLNDSSVRGMITSSLGNEAYKELKRWVENCWQEPRGANDWVSRAIGFIRGKTVTAIMAYRTSVALLNFANTVYMARELDAWNALCALKDFYSRPTEISKMRKAILEQSPFMANRANNIDRDIRKAQENSFAPGNPLTEMISEYGSWAIEETDMLCSMPTYHWTYKQTLNAELEKGTKPEDAKKKAHRAAEDVVRKIFGSADTVDQSAIQRSKNEFIKALTPFYTFVSTQANAIFEGYLKGRYQGSVRTIRDDGTIQTEKKAFLRRYWVMANAFLWTNLIGTLVEQIFRDAIGKLTGDDDDGLLDPTSEAFLRRWTAQSMTTFTSAVPIGNIMGEAIVKHITGKYYGGRNFGVADAALGRFGDAISAAFDLAEGKKDVIDAGRSVAKAIGGSFYGMPDTFTDTIFNAARAYKDNYSLNEWFIKSLFDKKLKKKGR